MFSRFLPPGSLVGVTAFPLTRLLTGETWVVMKMNDCGLVPRVEVLNVCGSRCTTLALDTEH
jgi:hypothetical protein